MSDSAAEKSRGECVGFVGLGNMGGALASNLVASGFEVIAFDVAGPQLCPSGATFAEQGVAEVARRTPVVVLSLPDGTVSESVAAEVADLSARERQTRYVVDTSTVGLDSARSTAELLAIARIGYVDAPVSGGPAGARARTLAVMYAGREEDCSAVEPVLAGLSDRRFRVGLQPGMGQAVKLANNFLSATALAATSEAIAFTTSVGLEMATVLEVLNASSGRNTATSDKFVNHVVTGRYASGFANTLMSKDVQLYLAALASPGYPSAYGELAAGVWERFAKAEPGVDFTRIYPFTVGAQGGSRSSMSDPFVSSEPAE